MDLEREIKLQAAKLRINHLTGNLSELECESFLRNFLKAINYTRCCESDSEQLNCSHEALSGIT